MYTKVSKAKVKFSELHTKNGMKMTMHQIYPFYQYQQNAREADQLRPIYTVYYNF